MDWSKYSEILPNMVSHVIITYFSIGIAHAQPFRDQLKKGFVFLQSVLPIAQLVERQTVVLKVVGSNPAW